MALAKRSTPNTAASTRDLKQRVITCLNKLSDRDTTALATSELESIARNLSQDSFPPFLNCIYFTDPTLKSPVRKQCARLLGFVSETHGDALSPHLSKMLGNVVRRLRDSDTAVRSACIDAVSAMAAHITKPPFSVFLKVLTEAVLTEQDYNSQIGSALCLASAIEAAPDPEPSQLQKLLPRLLKLLKSESFKAKPALLSLIGSIVGVGGGSSHNVVESLVPRVVEFLSSEDWAARKAAAEVLERLALVERSLLLEFKSSCLATFESRRFDKVKVVRETMNRMLEAWRDVPDVSYEVSPPPQSKSSRVENASDGVYPTGSISSATKVFELSQCRDVNGPKRRLSLPSKSAATNGSQRSPLKNNEIKARPALFWKKPANWKVEIAVPDDPTFSTAHENDLLQGHKDERAAQSWENENSASYKSEAKHSLLSKDSYDRTYKSCGSRARTRVFPLRQEDSLESTVAAINFTQEPCRSLQNSEDLSLIRKQLLQIENQQSSLLDLLQKFMGSSQNGMHALETRVHGLEIALDEISYDIAVSTGRISNPDTVGNTCCKLPGAEFLSSKFWRKSDGRYSITRFSSSRGTPSKAATLHNLSDRDSNTGPNKLENWRLRLNGGGGFIVNPLADNCSELRENSEAHLITLQKNAVCDSETKQCSSCVDVASSMFGIPPMHATNRCSA